MSSQRTRSCSGPLPSHPLLVPARPLHEQFERGLGARFLSSICRWSTKRPIASCRVAFCDQDTSVLDPSAYAGAIHSIELRLMGLGRRVNRYRRAVWLDLERRSQRSAHESSRAVRLAPPQACDRFGQFDDEKGQHDARHRHCGNQISRDVKGVGAGGSHDRSRLHQDYDPCARQELGAPTPPSGPQCRSLRSGLNTRSTRQLAPA
jgi:hypothetical protein